ncbi:MAG: hypothetical protein KatS3mg076_1684 [Candidatus Binatia bacterium]|nr:MAG: hypothetical protein KatS3mg076_1684 [Candidatus Binatia bacterium]
MLNLVKKIVGTKNDRELKRLWPVVREINALEERIAALSDEELRAKTEEFRSKIRERTREIRERLEQHEKELREGGAEVDREELHETVEKEKQELLEAEKEVLDEILPEAFACVREASKRTIGLRHYDVQMLGAIVLHQGKIAEMKTGEGKTLVATCPLYLNALLGRGVHLVTVNDYLARRDVQWMGPIYHALGVSVAVIVHEESFLYDPTYVTSDYRMMHLRPVSRREAYHADITYGTNHEFGFDYLRDNMKLAEEEFVQRELYYAIVDEVDNILIDEARTPLIISGPAEDSTDLYYRIDKIVPRLKRGAVLQGDARQEERPQIEASGDYVVDEKSKTVVLTEQGVAKVERLLGIDNLYDPANINILHHVNQALKAHAIFRRDVDYVVKNGQVIIVDEFTGRLMEGRRWSDGLHQAVEAKEGLRIQRENQTLATITIQNYFRMYHKLAGMTGTADTEAVEFDKIYKLQVVVIPPNKPMIRVDHPDVVYKTEREKFQAVIEEIAECHARGQPVLVGTVSVEKSERLSKMLKARGIPHNVLNAVNHEAEASVIAQAGRKGQVTIATNMAGRGTDILLGGNPEFLARAEIENEWIRRAEVLPSGHTRYEDALVELREKFERKVQKAREKYEKQWKPYEERQAEALERLTATHRAYLEAALVDARRRYEDAWRGLGEGAGSEAYAACAEALEAYCQALRDFDRVTGPHLGEEGERRFRDTQLELAEVLRAAVSNGGAADGLESARSAFERARSDYERAVEKALRNGNLSLEEARAAYEEAQREFEEAEEAFLRHRKPYEQAVAAAQREYEETRRKYTQVVEELREQMDRSPDEFRDRYQELLAKYREQCAREREEVVAAGGLHIIGTERHESRRIDNQLRGRAGRQGDPGSSRFYLSLEDDLLRIFGADRIKGIMERLGMEEGEPIEHRMISRAIANAQSKVEAHNFDIRKHLLEYDDVLNKQREVVYARRREILSRENLKPEILEMVDETLSELLDRTTNPDLPPAEWDWTVLEENLLKQFSYRLRLDENERENLTADELEEKLREALHAAYEEKERDFTPETLRHFEKFVMLQTLDSLWKDHLLAMDHLKEGIGLRGYGQRNPLQEYQKEGFELFQEMMRQFREGVVEKLYAVQIVREEQRQRVRQMRLEEHEPRRLVMSGGGRPAAAPKTETVRRTGGKVGRNDPCPCGSGKKYKKCHGA